MNEICYKDKHILLFKNVMLKYEWNINDISNERYGGRTPLFYNANVVNMDGIDSYRFNTLMIDVIGLDYREPAYINYGDDLSYEVHYWTSYMPKTEFLYSSKSLAYLVDWVEQYVFTRKALQHIIQLLIDDMDILASIDSTLTKQDLLTILNEPQNLDNDWI